MSFVSPPTWVSNQSLDSFHNQQSSSPAIGGGCNPIALLIYVRVLYIGVKSKTRNYIVKRE